MQLSASYFVITCHHKLPRQRRKELWEAIKEADKRNRFPSFAAAEIALGKLPKDIAADCYVTEQADMLF